MKKYFQKLKRDEGLVVAEFAVTIPILVLVTSLCFWTIGISITKFQLENFVHQKARMIARGESYPEELNNSAPNGAETNVIELENKVRVEGNITRNIPLINKEIELFSTAESLRESYEYQ